MFPSWSVDSWNPRCDAIIGDVSNHYGVRANGNVVADRNRSQYLGASAYVDVVADDGRAGFIDSPEPDNDAIAYAAVVTELGVTADDYSAKVIDDEVPADLYLTWQLDSCDDLNCLKSYLV